MGKGGAAVSGLGNDQIKKSMYFILPNGIVELTFSLALNRFPPSYKQDS